MRVEHCTHSARTAPWRHVGIAIVAFALSVAGATAAFAQAAESLAAEPSAAFAEDEIKAAFLYNFSTYVEWPADPGDTITIAVLGARDVAEELTRFVRDRTVEGRPVRVRRLRALSELNGDDVLYIGPAENRRLPELVDALRGRPTLLVTDAPDGLALGAMINFRIVDQRVRFEVSVPRAQDAGLVLSSRLLSAALYVETSRRWPDATPEPPVRVSGARPGLAALEWSPRAELRRAALAARTELRRAAAGSRAEPSQEGLRALRLRTPS